MDFSVVIIGRFFMNIRRRSWEPALIQPSSRHIFKADFISNQRTAAVISHTNNVEMAGKEKSQVPKMPVRKANAVLLKIVEDGINKRASKMQLCQYFFLSPHN